MEAYWSLRHPTLRSIIYLVKKKCGVGVEKTWTKNNYTQAKHGSESHLLVLKKKVVKLYDITMGPECGLKYFCRSINVLGLSGSVVKSIDVVHTPL